MRIVILAAGYGTRLYPITLNKPKALISISGRCILDYIMDKIACLEKEISIDEIIVVSNNKFYSLFRRWQRDGAYAITIVNDGTDEPSERLGAIGDINFALSDNRNDDFLVIGSDNYFDWDLIDFVKFALKKRPDPTIGVYMLEDIKKAVHFGVVTLDDAQRITEFVEKPKNPHSSNIATCIYFFPKESLYHINNFIRDTGNRDASGKYIEWLKDKTTIYGYRFSGKWIDVGHKISLEEAQGL